MRCYSNTKGECNLQSKLQIAANFEANGRKYKLDMAIWADRKVRGPDRPFVQANM